MNNKDCSDNCKIPDNGIVETGSLQNFINTAKNFSKLQVKVFGKPGCEKCEFVKKYLQEKKVDYDFYDINTVDGLTEASIYDAIDIPVVIFEDGAIETFRWTDRG